MRFRRKTFLCASFVCNAVYALFLLAVSQASFSKWFFVMSIYYGLLAAARIFIFLQVKCEKKLILQIKTMRACGIFLFLINLVVSAMMFFLIYKGGYVKHHEITVIALATYTFSSLTVAIVSSIKQLRKNDYVYACVKAISLISASVSLVTLTNTMLVTFGEENVLLRSIILPLLSGTVAVFIIVSAVFMIRKANLNLRKLGNEQERK